MKRTIALMALSAVVSHTLARSTYPILLPAIQDELLSSHQQAGLLTTINFSAYLAGVLLVTAISGRAEPSRLLFGGLACATAGFALLATAGSFATLAAGLAFAGIGSSGIWMTVPVIATSAVGPDRRGTVMGLLSSTMGLGVVTVTQGTNAVRRLSDDETLWRPTWVVGAIYAASILALAMLVLRVPATARVTGGLSLNRLRAVPGWLPLTMAYWLFGFIVSSFTPFFGAALEEFGFGRAHVGNLYALFGLSAAIGAVSLGRVSDRIGRRPVLLGAMMVMAGAALLVLTGTEPFAAMAALGFGAASFTFPVLIAAYLSDHLEGRAFSNALGAMTLIYGTALIVGPVVSGTIGDSSLGFPVVFSMVAVTCILAIGVLLGLDRPGIHSVATAPWTVVDDQADPTDSAGREVTAATAPNTTRPPKI